MVMIAYCVLAFWLAAAQGQQCRTKGKGKLQTFSSDKANINVPCKYHMTTMFCQGYKIHVAPGQAYDPSANYFTDTVWVSIKKEDSDYYWKARSSSKLIKRYFVTGDIDQPYRVKDQNMQGAPFQMEVSNEPSDFSVHFGVSDADFEIIFYGYYGDSKDMRKNNGVEVFCPDPTFVEDSYYPESLCGNTTSRKAIRQRKKELGIKPKSKIVIYDLLNNDRIVHTNPQCDLAGKIFRTCKIDAREAVNACADLVTNKKLIKCFHRYETNAMDVFIYCMKYKCEGSVANCGLMKDALFGCTTPKTLEGDCTA